MSIGEKAIEGPIKNAFSSVFDSINTNLEVSVFYSRYKDAHFKVTKEIITYINILGMSEPIELIDIYSPTKISTSIHRRLYKQDWRDINDKRKISKVKQSYKNINALDYIEEHRKVIILGAPGAGKTTFSKYFTLANIDDLIFQKSKLKSRYFPFYISLPSYSEISDDKTIEEYIYEKLITITDEHAKTFVKKKMKQKDTIILLDSLDEVPREKKEQIINKINDFCNNHINIKIVVSCRVSDYNGELNAFNEVEIARLSNEAITKIIKAWFKKESQKAKKLLSHLNSDDDVYSLTETPLLLSLVCIQFNHDLNIPNRKTELYRRCIEALLRTWDTSRNFRRDTIFTALSDDRKEKIFEHIAYEFIKNDFSFLFKKDELIYKISEKLEQYTEIKNDDAIDVLSEIEKHHGILEQYSAEAYFFSHPSFQEYFTAKAILSKRKEMDFIKKYYADTRSYTIIPFILSMSDEPSLMIDFLIKQSTLKNIKTYPAMAKRTNVLHLLYKSLISGVAINQKEKEKICTHIIETQINITNIYSKGGVYPIAVLEPNGVRHTYYYINKRQTLYDALQPFRRLATEILLSGYINYTSIALKRINTITYRKDDYIQIGAILCLIIPLSNTNPNEVRKKLEEIDSNVTSKSNSYLKEIIKTSLTNLRYYTINKDNKSLERK